MNSISSESSSEEGQEILIKSPRPKTIVINEFVLKTLSANEIKNEKHPSNRNRSFGSLTQKKSITPPSVRRGGKTPNSSKTPTQWVQNPVFQSNQTVAIREKSPRRKFLDVFRPRTQSGENTLLKLSKGRNTQKNWSDQLEKENVIQRACKISQSHMVRFTHFFDSKFPISQIKCDDAADSFRFFFRAKLEEIKPFFLINGKSFNLPEQLDEESKENFLMWLITNLNEFIPVKSTLDSRMQVQMLCNGPSNFKDNKALALLKSQIPCYPILQSLSFGAFSTATFFLSRNYPAFFSNKIGELHIKNFPKDPTRFLITIDPQTGKYEATQIKLHRFYKRGESEEEHLFLGHVELHWTISGVLRKSTRTARLQFLNLQLDKQIDKELRYRVVEQFGLLHLDPKSSEDSSL